MNPQVTTDSDIFSQFRHWYEYRHDYCKKWKARTKTAKIVGYFCTYAPEELFYAFDILPIRILGGHEPQDVTEPHIFGMYCPFCRDCLSQGLRGFYNYLDGIMIAQSCLHIRQAFCSWQLHLNPEYAYYLYMPNKVQSKHALPYLVKELELFNNSLEAWSGKKLTVDNLRTGINIVNRTRMLLNKLYELRKRNPPLLTGTDAMYVVISSQLIDKREYNPALENLLETLTDETIGVGGSEDKIRLMLIGSENDDIEFLKMVEQLDAVVVTDDHCTGSRYFWNLVEINNGKNITESNLLESIAKRYIERPPCPSKDWEQRLRVQHILELAKNYQVQGAIFIQQKFCDPHELDIPVLKRALESVGIPTLFLEFDVTVPVGQLKVRVEAFLEMIRGEELF